MVLDEIVDFPCYIYVIMYNDINIIIIIKFFPIPGVKPGQPKAPILRRFSFSIEYIGCLHKSIKVMTEVFPDNHHCSDLCILFKLIYIIRGTCITYRIKSNMYLK
jgi:hypothetical protein